MTTSGHRSMFDGRVPLHRGLLQGAYTPIVIVVPTWFQFCVEKLLSRDTQSDRLLLLYASGLQNWDHFRL